MLGKKIKELRLISGLTQEDVAIKTGLTQRTIQRIENHKVEPSEYSLNQIGEVFKVNLNKMKLDEKNKKQKWLNIFLVSILQIAHIPLSRLYTQSLTYRPDVLILSS